MVRINLLKDIKRKKRRSQRKPIPVKLIKSLALVCALLTVGAGAYFVIKSGLLSRPVQTVQAPEPAPANKITYSTVVEDVVHEGQSSVDVQAKDGVLHLPYAELSTAEKINYEIEYAKNVVDLLAATVPANIGLKTVEARDFQSILGVGVCASQAVITDFFSALRSGESVELLPKPQTNITGRDKDFQFVFTGKKEFGLNLKSPSVNLSLAQLPLRDDLSATLGRFVKIAADNEIKTVQSPRQLAAEPYEQFRRFRYEYVASATYGQFVQFVHALLSAGVPCAFESFRLTAQTSNQVRIEARLLFTTLN